MGSHPAQGALRAKAIPTVGGPQFCTLSMNTVSFLPPSPKNLQTKLSQYYEVVVSIEHLKHTECLYHPLGGCKGLSRKTFWCKIAKSPNCPSCLGCSTVFLGDPQLVGVHMGRETLELQYIPLISNKPTSGSPLESPKVPWRG